MDVESLTKLITALVTAVPPTVTGLMSLRKLTMIHRQYNSRMDELLDTMGREQYKLGVSDTEAKHQSINTKAQPDETL